MNFWQFLDKQIDRTFKALPGWPDGRGLVGIATFSLTVGVMVMYRNDPTLRDDDFFKTIATAVVITGFINAIVGWAFGDTAKSATAADNTGKFADAMKEQAITTRASLPEPSQLDVLLEPGETARAVDEDHR